MLKAMAFSLKLGKVALVYPVVKQVAAVGVEHLSQLVVSIAALLLVLPEFALLSCPAAFAAALSTTTLISP